MGKEKASRFDRTIRSVYDRIKCGFIFLRDTYSSLSPSRLFLNTSYTTFYRPTGFTLIELLVVVAVIGSLITSIIVLIDPVKQFNRADDTKHVDTLRQISTALNTFYQAQARFPRRSEFPTGGGNLASGGTVYMNKIPARNSEYGPFYFTNDANPAWYAIFWRKKFIDEGSTTQGEKDCSLERITGCTPSGYVSNHYYCLSGGEVQCSILSGESLP